MALCIIGWMVIGLICYIRVLYNLAKKHYFTAKKAGAYLFTEDIDDNPIIVKFLYVFFSFMVGLFLFVYVGPLGILHPYFNSQE